MKKLPMPTRSPKSRRLSCRWSENISFQNKTVFLLIYGYMRKNSRTSAGSQISLRERIVDNLELPKDLMLGAAIVTVTGRGEAVISNYKGILEYEDSFIRVQTKTCRIRITGVRLAIDYYTNEEMKITGSIDTIEYEN